MNTRIRCSYESKGKTAFVTGRGGLFGCETSRPPHFVDNRGADGSEVVSLMRWPLFTPHEDSWYLFLLEAESNPGPFVRLEGLSKLKKSSDQIGYQTRGLPA
jgi:hypothetical protein